jgi:DNA recombination protein RmuC
MDAALIVIAIVAVIIALAALVVVYRDRREVVDPSIESDRLLVALRGEIATLQQQALQQNNEQFLTLAESRLQAETGRGEEQLKARQSEIDRSVRQIAESLESMTKFVQTVDAKRAESITKLGSVMEESRRATAALGATTAELNRALSGGQTRGQWGERMAEDVLRIAGLLEGVNYLKNTQISGGVTRPDYTFLLPQQRVLHMDVKFPLSAYLRFLEAESDRDRDDATKDFLGDVRARIQEVTTREYIDPSHDTLDYMLVFIPNEQVYGFIHEQDATIAEEALRKRVVLCSPLTLFAILAVIRQSMENFQLEQHANEMLGAMGEFNKQWELFKKSWDDVGRRLEQTTKAYDTMSGTRTRQLDRRLAAVERLRVSAGIEPSGEGPEAIEAAVTIDDTGDTPET